MVNPLARVAMDNISKKVGYSKDNKSIKNTQGVSNITEKEEDMIRNIIHRNSKVETKTSRKSMMTLTEVVNMIKTKG